jgi:hypothetical protein
LKESSQINKQFYSCIHKQNYGCIQFKMPYFLEYPEHFFFFLEEHHLKLGCAVYSCTLLTFLSFTIWWSAYLS